MAVVTTRRGLIGFETEDDFDRQSGPLGRTPEGLPWRVFNVGESDWSISNSNAEIDNNRISRNPIAVVNVLSNNGYVTLKTSGNRGGNALYFRVLDGKNWWRVLLGLERDVRRTTITTPRWRTRWRLDRSRHPNVSGRYAVSWSGTTTSNRRPSTNRTTRSSRFIIGGRNTGNHVYFPPGESISDRRRRALTYNATSVERDGTSRRTSTRRITIPGHFVLQRSVNGSVETVFEDKFDDENEYEFSVRMENQEIKLIKDDSEIYTTTSDFATTSTLHGIGAGDHPSYMDRVGVSVDRFRFELL